MAKSKLPSKAQPSTVKMANENQFHAFEVEAVKRLAIIRNAPYSLIPREEINKIETLLKLRFNLLISSAQDEAALLQLTRQLRLVKAYLRKLKLKSFKRRRRIADLINKEEEDAQKKYLEEFKQHLEDMTTKDNQSIHNTYYPQFKMYIAAEIALASLTLLTIPGLSESYRNELEVALALYEKDPTPTAFKTLPRGLQLLTAGQMYDGMDLIDSHQVLAQYFPSLIDLIAIKADEITKRVLDLPKPQNLPTPDESQQHLIRTRAHSLLVGTHFLGKDDPQANPQMTDEQRINETTSNISSNIQHLKQLAAVVRAASIFSSSLSQNAKERDAILSDPLVTGIKPRPQPSQTIDEDEEKVKSRRPTKPSPWTTGF